jgi:HlyD family secretion protein
VRVDAYPGRPFKGKVARVAQEAEFTPRNVQTREDRDRLVYEVEIEVENPDDALRPGMPADVSLDGTGR